MIYVDKDGVKEPEFQGLLSRTKHIILKELSASEKRPSESEFEQLVCDRMSQAAEGTVFSGHIKKAKPYEFPDIIAKKYFGAEVKITIGNKWTTIGNSVRESSRVEGVERIYLFFGKFGGRLDIKYRLCEECLVDVAVTHYPRYRIDMELAAGKSIFDKLKIPYDKLRKDPLPSIRQYYKKNLKEGEDLWWLDNQTEEKSVSPVIRQFSKLDALKQKQIKVEAMILFPEIFGDSTFKFQRIPSYLIKKHNAVSANVRDIFTAGGVDELTIKRKTVQIPRIFCWLHQYANDTYRSIDKIDETLLKDYWSTLITSKPRIQQWLAYISKHSTWREKGLSIQDVFRHGLSKT